jgi:hypothetical protein
MLIFEFCRSLRTCRDAASLKDMKETLASMPQFQELKQKVQLGYCSIFLDRI